MKEEWRDVKGFESLYKVSNYGLVKRNSDGHIVPVRYRNDQPVLNLTKNKKQWCRSLHHLVAEAFIENHLNCKYVIHLDRDRTNNRVDNLMWACTEKKIYGVGINDIGITYDSNGKKCASYIAWSSMLQRCYQEQSLKKRPRYRGCSVCQEWLLYSNFKKWYECQENGYKGGYRVDKDIIKKGNKIYCPEFCCLVPERINTLFTNCNKVRGLYPVGVVRDGNRYCAHMAKDGKMIRLGNSATPEEAFLVYKQNKEQYIKEIAKEYYESGMITQRVYNAMLRYEIEITD